MKKVLGITCSLLLLAGCASENVQIEEAVETIMPSAVPTEVAEPEEEAVEESKENTPVYYDGIITPQMLYETEDITVYLDQVGEDDENYLFHMTVENHSDGNDYVYFGETIVNGTAVENGGGINVDAHTTETGDMTIEKNLLAFIGITSLDQIGTLETNINYMSNDTYDYIDGSEYFVLETSHRNQEAVPHFEGDVLYDENGICITAKFVKEEVQTESYLLLYVENHSDYYLEVDGTNAQLNGEAIYAFYPRAFAGAGSNAFDYEDLSFDMDYNGITEINDLKFDLNIIDNFNDSIIATVPVEY